ncbi:multicopper oxidase family protein [Natronoglycomyces albus]|uniref:Multicopper oxidase domain-containing protein n=1 Tax=Natronoglycomyces albus TaxID=2811108 RepID=A0A895XQB1_9ACTN|nr:multicopper oxidase domain-containing protein [Natronoglycomyces albus]QSB05325.1 multicopper oxidase domain-containing protein [Natronoglycomyces albus]
MKLAATSAAGSAAIASLGACGRHRAAVNTFGEIDFSNELSIPALAQARTDNGGTRVFTLGISAGETQIKPGKKTQTWGIDSSILGPTIRARRGEQIGFLIHNGLDETTSIHWHGMHLPAVMDGGPHQEMHPGAEWYPQWTVDQPAASLWYHPHPHGHTAEHVYRGLAGMFIIDDDETDALNLPSEYGVDDLPLIVQDKAFDEDNQWDASSPMGTPSGILGDEILVNGTHSPYFDVTTRLVRLRLLNGSTTHPFNFGFDDDRDFQFIATDGGLINEPFTTNRIMLTPGERAEIVVAFEPGDEAILRSYPMDISIRGNEARAFGIDDQFDICQFRATSELADDTEVPSTLAPEPNLDIDDVITRRNFQFSGTHINGKRMDMERIDFGVRLDNTELWTVENEHNNFHNFHVHDVQFQVVSLDGNDPPAHWKGWKDTIHLPNFEPVELLLRFTDYADPNIPYMFHCHVLRHEDDGMMGQFVVLEEGQEIGSVPDNAFHENGHG